MTDNSFQSYQENLNNVIQSFKPALDACINSLQQLISLKENILNQKCHTTPQEKVIVCLGLDYWVNCPIPEAVMIITRKENALKEKIEELENSIQFLEMRKSVIIDLTHDKPDEQIIDIREEMDEPSPHANNANNANNMLKLTTGVKDPPQTTATSDDRTRQRVAYASHFSLKEMERYIHPHPDKESIDREKKNLSDLFRKYEKEEEENKELDDTYPDLKCSSHKDMRDGLTKNPMMQPTYKIPLTTTKKSVRFEKIQKQIHADSGTEEEEDGLTDLTSDDFSESSGNDESDNYVDNKDILTNEKIMKDVWKEYIKMRDERQAGLSEFLPVQPTTTKTTTTNVTEDESIDKMVKPMSRFKAKRLGLYHDDDQ